MRMPIPEIMEAKDLRMGIPGCLLHSFSVIKIHF